MSKPTVSESSSVMTLSGAFASHRVYVIVSLCVLVLFFLAIKLNASNDGITVTCAYSPDSGQPNPLGMRTFITVTESRGHTDFLYEQFPQTVSADSPMTITVSRTLTMHNTPIQQARSLMRENNRFYETLIGYTDPVGFSTYDEAMVCRTIVAARPKARS